MERLFRQGGAFESLPADSETSPQERGLREQVPRGFLTESPGNTRIGYDRLRDGRWGGGIPDHVMKAMCEKLDGAATVSATLDSPDAFLQAIEQEIVEFTPAGLIAVVLAGSWRDMEYDLALARPERYVAAWQIPEKEGIGEMARFKDNPIFRGPHAGDARIHVVDVGSWGRLVRFQFEDGQDLKIEILPVSSTRARELLEANPKRFGDEPDEESKLRKLRTRVELIIGARHEFRVLDPSRARKIVAAGLPR